MVYDDFSFVSKIDTLDRVNFVMLLDPDRKLTRRFRVERFPTYVFLSWEADEVDRASNLAEVAEWFDDPASYQRALPERKEQVPAGAGGAGG